MASEVHSTTMTHVTESELEARNHRKTLPRVNLLNIERSEVDRMTNASWLDVGCQQQRDAQRDPYHFA